MKDDPEHPLDIMMSGRVSCTPLIRPMLTVPLAGTSPRSHDGTQFC